MTRKQTRRRFVIESAAAASAALVTQFAPSAAHAATPTPRQTKGPFYPKILPLDSDNDLTRVEGRSDRAKGEVTDVSGRVLDERGRPIRKARVEIWQCDANGRYHHPRDTNGDLEPDDAFQGYGQFITDDEGAYRFRTIKPVPYPGRTPHIHFNVSGEGIEPLSTQMYVKGEPGNRRDGIYNSVRDKVLRDSITVVLESSAADAAVLEGSFDIVLAADGRFQT